MRTGGQSQGREQETCLALLGMGASLWNRRFRAVSLQPLSYHGAESRPGMSGSVSGPSPAVWPVIVQVIYMVHGAK